MGAAVQALVPKTLPGTISPGIPAGGRSPAYPFVAVIPAASETSSGLQTPVGPTPAYCQVAFVYSPGGTGPNNAGPGLITPITTPTGQKVAAIPKGQPAYNEGETQQIQIVISLPLSAADGGNDPGAVQGNWAGGVLTGGSPGSSGTLSWAAFEEGLDMGGPAYAIRQGFVGTETDTGQTAAAAANGGSTNFAVIPSGAYANRIAYGAVADWIYRGTWYGRQWGDAIAKVYYGKEPKLHYYDGCSGGGNQGMGQLQNYGNEYDGILIGAPAYRWQQFRLADSWPALVMRKLVQLDGTSALLTSGQMTALSNAVVAACDVEGTDTVADQLIADPRLCTLNFSAQANVCGATGAPASPNCLTSDQAAAMGRAWDGPRNSQGARLWYPYDISIPLGGGGFTGFNVATVSLTGSTVQVVQWDHAVNNWDAQDCLFVDQASLELGTTNIAGQGSPAIAACGTSGPGVAYTYEQEQLLGSSGTKASGDNVTGSFPGIDLFSDNESPRLSKAADHRTKVMLIRGTADPAIRWRHDVDYYNRVAMTLYGGNTPSYAQLQKWFRFYPAPSVGHCGGGSGPYWYDPFVALRNWAEHGIVPTQLAGLTATTGVEPGRTRPICSFPQTAIYNGYGSTDDINSFHCGGNLETLPVACNDVKVEFGQETSANLDYKGVGLTASKCKPYLPPPHAGTSNSP